MGKDVFLGESFVVFAIVFVDFFFGWGFPKCGWESVVWQKASNFQEAVHWKLWNSTECLAWFKISEGQVVFSSKNRVKISGTHTIYPKGSLHMGISYISGSFQVGEVVKFTQNAQVMFSALMWVPCPMAFGNRSWQKKVAALCMERVAGCQIAAGDCAKKTDWYSDLDLLSSFEDQKCFWRMRFGPWWKYL